jgi:hypothetical protein
MDGWHESSMILGSWGSGDARILHILVQNNVADSVEHKVLEGNFLHLIL